MTQEINEDTTLANAANIATTDQNLSVEQMFQQTTLPSLGKQIFSVLPIDGPTAALFNVKSVDNAGAHQFKLLRNEVEVYSSNGISSGISKENVQDLKSQYNKDAYNIIGNLLHGLTNEEQNEKTLEFLDTEAVAVTGLVISKPENSQIVNFEITNKVQELVLKMNTPSLRTYEAFAVVPASYVAGIMAFNNANFSNGLFIGRIGMTSYFVNPDATATQVFVGLKDSYNPSKSSAVFSPYAISITEAVDPDTGDMVYWLFDRFAITVSPLHETGSEMLYKFDISQ